MSGSDTASANQKLERDGTFSSVSPTNAPDIALPASSQTVPISTSITDPSITLKVSV